MVVAYQLQYSRKYCGYRFLQEIIDVFGDPISVLRDMGIAIKESITFLFVIL